MVMPLATDRAGNALIDLTVATNEQLAEAALRTRCPLALMVVADASSRSVLFGLNRWRCEYELPGGMIEEGESFIAAAARELEEETSIRIETPELIGYARFELNAPRREELAAVYGALLPDARPQASHEMQSFIWRTPLSESTAPIGLLDDVIAEWAVRS